MWYDVKREINTCDKSTLLTMQ